ncbi:trypsin-like serine protease [Coleofasciculus sp. E1-EBD-02]|uniref:trypsin-like serine protease n=1 Tax=Coleofasciculus sp. E1-EBD-02 TaxID=3068481 RepID=UPI0033022069
MTFTLSSFKSLTLLSVVSLLTPLVSVAPAKAVNLNNTSIQTQVQPLYTTAGNPDDYLVSPGTGYDGVAQLSLGGFWGTSCTGGLLGTGAHILTAAHCLTDDFGNLDIWDGTATFELSTGDVNLSIADIFVHDDWTGDLFNGYDLAILELTDVAPDTVDRYDIYRNDDEVGKTGEKVGYGRSGNGNVGDVFWDGLKRSGQNRYDASGDLFDQHYLISDDVTDALLAYDFDNGLAANDAFGYWFGDDYADLGLGLNEVNSAPGDSGGPTFIDGAIAGVTSFGLQVSYWNGISSDIDYALNSSFGEFSFDTRVSSYTNWIDDILTSWQPPTPPVVDNPADDIDENLPTDDVIADDPIDNTPDDDIADDPIDNTPDDDIADDPIDNNPGDEIPDNPDDSISDNIPSPSDPVSVSEPRSLAGLMALATGLWLTKKKKVSR